MKKALFFLIIVCMLFVSCKDKGNESASDPAATTPLEGSWRNTATSTGATETTTLTFGGSNVAMVIAGESATDPSDPSNPPEGTLTMAFNMTATFRLDNNQILITPKTATLSMIIIPTADPSTPMPLANESGDNALSLLNMHLNQESSLGTYTLNGTTLSLTFTGDSSATPFNKLP